MAHEISVKRFGRGFPWWQFAVLMVLDVGAMLCEKMAAIHAEGSGWGLMAEVLSQPWVYVVVGIKLGQLLLWTAILRRVDISVAFPITAIHIPLVMVCSMGLFKEKLEWTAWVGAVLVVAGIVVLGPSHEEEAREGDSQEAVSPGTLGET